MSRGVSIDIFFLNSLCGYSPCPRYPNVSYFERLTDSESSLRYEFRGSEFGVSGCIPWSSCLKVAVLTSVATFSIASGEPVPRGEVDSCE